jgi:23S rRNA (guanosine2251-2'-O)-methyltransferase
VSHTGGVVPGLHAVRVLLERAPQRARLVCVQEGRRDARLAAIVALATQAQVPVDVRTATDLDRLCPGQRHQGIVALLAAVGSFGEGALDELLDRSQSPPLLLVLDGVEDPHNLGACLRTADAAGAVAVVVPRDRAAGLSATVRKVAAGAAETTPLVQVVNLARTLRWLKERGLWIVGAAGEAQEHLYATDLRGPIALVLGAEAGGLRRLTREQCDRLVRIPMAGAVESLNVAVAAGVLLFEALRQRAGP